MTCCSQDQLKAVTIIHRHGERTILATYPKDPYRDSKFWTASPGELTNVGKQQMFELGRWLRQRYDGFLSETYEPNEIYVLSSNKDRCLASAAANLAGLYPPKDKDIWHPNLAWNPIPIHSIPEKYDDIIYIFNSSPEIIAKWNEDIEVEDECLSDFLTEQTGQKMRKKLDIVFLYDILYTEESFNLKLPEWTRDVYPHKLKKFRDDLFKKFVSTPKAAKWSVGRFFHEVLHQMEDYIESDNPRVQKMKLYSGHDININAILDFLKVPHDIAIPVAAAVMIELRQCKKSGDFYVQLVYKTDQVQVFSLRDSGKRCGFLEFKETVKDVAVPEISKIREAWNL